MVKKATTQKFTEIQEIIDDVVIFSKGRACLVLELNATNFSLLSKEEQDSKIVSFAALLNSLSFPIQIVIRNKKLDISSYLRLLDEEMKKTTNQNLATQIKLYKDFVQDLVKVQIILDKRFYIVIPFSYLENPVEASKSFVTFAKSTLRSKAQSIHSQLGRLNLKAKTLPRDELTKLFHDLYNEGSEAEIVDGIKSPVVRGGQEHL